MAKPQKYRLGELLVQQSLVTTAQLEEALVQQKQSGRKLGRVLVEMGLVTEESISTAIANQLGQFREVIENAARDLAPHLIAFYLKDLAGEFHGWYNAERMLVEDEALKEARIALAAAIRQVIRNGLAILGVSCPESM